MARHRTKAEPAETSKALVAAPPQGDDSEQSRARDEFLERTGYQEPERPQDWRVRQCAALMTAGKWVRGETGPLLAKEWGVEIHVVERASAEAGRFLRLVRAPELSIEHVLMQLHVVLERACEPLEKVAAARAILDGYKSFGYKGGGAEQAATPPAQAQESLEAELMNPGPELVEALANTGWRRVVETTADTLNE